MSEDQEEPQPTRRSTRERKSVVRFAPAGTSTRQPDDGHFPDGRGDGSDEGHDEEEAEEEDGDVTTTFKASKARSKSTNTTGKRSASTAKRPVKKSKSSSRQAQDDVFESAELGVEEDNELFQAVRHTNTALELTVEEWISSYTNAQAASQSDDDVEASKGPALANLLNFVLRCFGCNSSVDQYEAVDVNNYRSKQQDILHDFQQSTESAYPLVVRTKTPKRFRKSLNEFMDRLIRHSHTSDILYDDLFYPALNAWVATATSSKLRPFRHTATVIALDMVSAMCRIAAEVAKELASLNRQKEAETKKARADKSRLKILQNSVAQTHRQKEALEQKMNDLFTSVYIHRYKDSEATIRAECTRSLGEWMNIYPDYYLEGNHLRYIGWQLTDTNKEARMEAIRALDSLYSKPDYLGSLQIFTERFKARFVEMATGDPEITIRRLAISVLEAVEKHGLLEDDQREQLAQLIYHVDARVRSAIAPYFVSLTEEAVEEAMDAGAHGRDDDVAKTRLWFKQTASLLRKHAEALDVASASDGTADPSQVNRSLRYLPANSRAVDKSRLSFVVEAFWSVADDIQDWEALAEYLLLDHSGLDDLTPDTSNRKGKGRAERDADGLPEAQILSEEEETLLLDIFASAVAKRKSELEQSNQASRKSGEEELANEQVTRSMMKLLPLLVAKYQGFPERLLLLLPLTLLMNMDLYLEMRVISSYEELWEDISRLFLRQTDPRVIETCSRIFQYFMSCGVLSETNKTKLAELLKILADETRNTVSGLEIETVALDEDKILAFSACTARMSAILQRIDCTKKFDDTGGMQHTSLWEIADALAERGRLGIEGEAELVINSLSVLHTHCMRRFIGLGPEIDMQDSWAAAYFELRDKCTERLISLAFLTGGNVLQSVKRDAFCKLLQIYTMAKLVSERRRISEETETSEIGAALDLDCPDELQHRCVGYIQSEIRRYEDSHFEVVSTQTNGVNGHRQDEDGSATEEEEDEASPQKRTPNRSSPQKKKTKHRGQEIINNATIEDESLLQISIAAFTKAICLGILSLKHGSVVLSQQGRFGKIFDECVQPLLLTIKEEALSEDCDGPSVIKTVSDALCESLNLHVDHEIDEDTFIATARSLAATIKAHGPRLKIEARLPDKHYINLHQTVVTRVLQQVASYENTDRLQKSERALLAFKALGMFLAATTPSEAATIQSHLESEMTRLKLDNTEDRWYFETAYARKLSNIVDKEDGSNRPTKRVRTKKGAVNNMSEADEGQASDGNDPEASAGKSGKRGGRPKAKTKPAAQPARSRQPRASEKTINYADLENEAVDMDEEADILPASRASKFKSTFSGNLPARPTVDKGSAMPEEMVSTLRVTPRKRPREDEAGSEQPEDEAEDEDHNEHSDTPERERSPSAVPDEDALEAQLTALSPSRPRPPASQESQMSLSHFKKKRRRI